MPEANKQLARRFIEDVLVRCSAAAAAEIIAEQYTEHAPAPFGDPAPGVVSGPQHAVRVARWLHQQFPDLEMTIEALVAEGDTVAMRVSSAGTNLGRFNGVLPPTGKRFVSAQCHWFRVVNNRLAEHWAVRDDLSVVLQLGIIGQRGEAGVDAGAPRHSEP
jgi:predicted SnoaL-like aldol condensation-catalyzing enzyme